MVDSNSIEYNSIEIKSIEHNSINTSNLNKNSIESKISEAWISNQISHEDFIKNYRSLKESIRMMKGQEDKKNRY